MRLRVSNAPPKPLMIWDGECHFCKRWVERWREITAGRIDYVTYQQAAQRFPEIPIERFKSAVALLEPDGEVLLAAEAVYRSLAHQDSRKWLAWSYDHIPGFAAISEAAYKFIARNRSLGSTVTRVLWGKDVRPPTYFWARRWFLRMLGLIYLIAFVSFWVQADGLIGSDGVSPVNQFLPAVRAQVGSDGYALLPTLCWFNSSNAFVHFLCGGGVAVSLVLILGIAPAVCLAVLFVFYLSLTIAGQVFFSFQWDILLLETGFLSIFFAPWRLWPQDLSWRPRSFGVPPLGSPEHVKAEFRAPSTAASPVSRAALFLLKFLLFKLILMSGVVKLTSGDDCWWNLTALDYHYWSQPLPTLFGWWADKSPEWFKHFSVAFCLAVELIVPFFIWAPRRLRLIAATLMIFLQLAIAVTGNYCFFNLLTIALCLLLIDDSVAASLCRGALLGRDANIATQRQGYSRMVSLPNRLCSYAAIAVIVVTLPVNAWLIFAAFKAELRPPNVLGALYAHLEAFRIVNGYGLFRVMTKDRDEIVFEGSMDGIQWLPYEFKWKPGDVKHPPAWCAPHQPRLDWQMWFAALESPRQNPWFLNLIVRLLQGSRDVTGLLAQNPFPDKPPHYVRAMFYRYRFTSASEHGKTGAWWKRQELREYFPTVSVDQLR
ncbi:MAG TPA: lipase maturation factor family protein [Candidatus Udaeobacter sp.]|nr:lipase maturation factor family protein [Candidatus Udaeobacter sp.]